MNTSQLFINKFNRNYYNQLKQNMNKVATQLPENDDKRQRFKTIDMCQTPSKTQTDRRQEANLVHFSLKMSHLVPLL